MSKPIKLIKKIEQLHLDFFKNIRGNAGKINKREEVLADSDGVLAYMRGIQRRHDDSFGLDVVSSEPRLAAGLEAVTFDRHDFTGGGDNGLRIVLASGLISTIGIRPGDKVDILEGEKLGFTYEVKELVSDTEIRLDADDAGKSPESNLQVNFRLSTPV